MFPELVERFLTLRSHFMGPLEDMENHPGLRSKNGGTRFAPTYFETLGQNSVKTNRCYSTSMTHQRPRSLVGPTAGGKAYDDIEMNENLKLRKRVLEVLTYGNALYVILTVPKLNSQAAMIVLRDFLPKDDLAILDENFQLNNLPRIGSDDNTAFPGGQINLAGAISQADSHCSSNCMERHVIYLLLDSAFSMWPGQYGVFWQASQRRA